MKTSNVSNPIMIFAGTNWEAGVLKSNLENAKIEVLLKEEGIDELEPRVGASGEFGSVKVFVSGSDIEVATEIVSDFKKNNTDNGE
ncbi:MAG TPA: hypothetical protein P5210_05745 [Draconibacterium sp.]|nr:hypothetical protein [Draconibacterium sp.]HRX11130.1 hypothetical protein [Draconibacterium sp.]